VRYAYGITAALLLGGTAATLAFQSPAASQSDRVEAAASVSALTTAPRPGAPMSFADLVAKLQPAVVNITTRQKVQVGTSFDPSTGGQSPVVRKQEGGGSGFLISTDGYIVTNNHVITSGEDGAQLVDTVTVRLTDGRDYKAAIIGRDQASDLAVLKIDATGLPFVEFGDSTKVRVGDWVVAIGNPFSLGSTVTAGIVSALQRNTGQGGAYDRFIQTDTAINQGNSGGPLFDLNGRVIGINNRLISPVGANVGINFAIPAESAISIVESLKNGKTVSRGYLGIGIAPVDDRVAAAFGLPKNHGEIIQQVEPGQAAAQAGLKPGDVVIKVNGRDVSPQQTLSYIVANIHPGTKVPLDIIRDGKAMTLSATVGTRPTEDKLAAARGFDPKENKPFNKEDDGKAGTLKYVRETLGFSVIPLTSEIASDIGIDPATKGVVIDAVLPASDAAEIGFRRGDVIMAANFKPVATPAALIEQIQAAKKLGRSALILEVRRQGTPSIQVAVQLSE
jgi:serine protease Do